MNKETKSKKIRTPTWDNPGESRPKFGRP